VIEIRSYRRVFELERRIYRIDRLRLNPAGVPVRGIVYFLVLAAVGVIAGGLPLARTLARSMPWYLRGLVLPGVGAALLTLVRLEGRPFHVAARALLTYRTSPRRLVGLERGASVGACWRPGEILMLPDGSDAHIRRLLYTGPGAVLISVEHERILGGARRVDPGSRWGTLPRRLIVRELPGGRGLPHAQVVALARGAQLATRCSGQSEPRARGVSHRPELAVAESSGKARA
jgi:hypothetical protein